MHDESNEAAADTGFYYLCTQRRNYHHRFSFEADTYRPHVNPNVDELSIHHGNNLLIGLIWDKKEATQEVNPLTKFPIYESDRRRSGLEAAVHKGASAKVVVVGAIQRVNILAYSRQQPCR